MFIFWKIWCALFSCNSHFEICLFALLPTKWLVMYRIKGLKRYENVTKHKCPPNPIHNRPISLNPSPSKLCIRRRKSPSIPSLEKKDFAIYSSYFFLLLHYMICSIFLSFLKKSTLKLLSKSNLLRYQQKAKYIISQKRQHVSKDCA